MTPLLLALSIHLAADSSFEPLFNGEDLSGWKIPEGDNGHWRVVDGVIDYDAASESPQRDKSIYTEREFGDFVLELEWRYNREPAVGPTPIVLPDGSYLRDATGEKITVPRVNGDSGVYLRGTSKAQVNIWGWPVGSGEMYGFRNPETSPPELRRSLTPRMKADKPVGEWNKFTIVLVGRQLTVLLNDQTVIDRAELPESVPMSGPIALQHHGGWNDDGTLRPMSSVVQFRNVMIRELPRPE